MRGTRAQSICRGRHFMLQATLKFQRLKELCWQEDKNNMRNPHHSQCPRPHVPGIAVLVVSCIGLLILVAALCPTHVSQARQSEMVCSSDGQRLNAAFPRSRRRCGKGREDISHLGRPKPATLNPKPSSALHRSPTPASRSGVSLQRSAPPVCSIATSIRSCERRVWAWGSRFRG